MREYIHKNDNYIAIGAAMRGRYTKNGKTEQLEVIIFRMQ